MRSLKCGNIFSYGQRRKIIFFFKTVHWCGLKHFKIITFPWGQKILEQVWEFSHKFFWEARYQLLMCSYDIRSFWFIITHCNLPKRLVTLSGSLVKLSGSYVNICCMSHQLGNVSIQHKPWVPFGVILLIQRVHY